MLDSCKMANQNITTKNIIQRSCVMRARARTQILASACAVALEFNTAYEVRGLRPLHSTGGVPPVDALGEYAECWCVTDYSHALLLSLWSSIF